MENKWPPIGSTRASGAIKTSALSLHTQSYTPEALWAPYLTWKRCFNTLGKINLVFYFTGRVQMGKILFKISIGYLHLITSLTLWKSHMIRFFRPKNFAPHFEQPSSVACEYEKSSKTTESGIRRLFYKLSRERIWEKKKERTSIACSSQRVNDISLKLGTLGKKFGHEYIRSAIPCGMNMVGPPIWLLCFLEDEYRGTSYPTKHLNETEIGYNCRCLKVNWVFTYSTTYCNNLPFLIVICCSLFTARA